MLQPSQNKVAESAGDGAQNQLTRDNLDEFTAADRRERAHQRGQSTPSPEPDFHEYREESTFSELMTRRKLFEERVAA